VTARVRPFVVVVLALATAVTTSGCRKERVESSGDAGPATPASASASASLPPTPPTSERAHAAMARAHVPGISFASVSRTRSNANAIGLAHVERQDGLHAETVLEAASIAKLIVATCVMQLVEDRRLDLDTDVGTYVGFAVRHPGFSERITLRMLLTHRASIRDLDSELLARADGNPLGPFLKRYLVRDDAPRAAVFLEDRPGTRLTYSNVGAALAALAVERVSGESFAAFSARRVFAPLQMRRTSWSATEPARFLGATPPAQRDVATPHAYRGGAFVALPAASHAVYPAVDLHAPVTDLARFACAILRDGELDGARILSASSVQAMLRADAPDAEQAVGWQLRTLGGRRVVGHEGEDAGASTGLFLDLQAGTGAVVLTNGDAFGSADPARAEAIQTMISELLATSR
jgi:CubicO group peptidase (beta-lactamase class C family)